MISSFLPLLIRRVISTFTSLPLTLLLYYHFTPIRDTSKAYLGQSDSEIECLTLEENIARVDQDQSSAIWQQTTRTNLAGHPPTQRQSSPNPLKITRVSLHPSILELVLMMVGSAMLKKRGREGSLVSLVPSFRLGVLPFLALCQTIYKHILMAIGTISTRDALAAKPYNQEEPSPSRPTPTPTPNPILIY